MRRIGLVLTLTVTLALCATATARATTTRPGVPAGFLPQSVSAVSAMRWWVLGSVPCPGTNCWDNSLVRTEDGGSSFEQMPVPVVKDVVAASWDFSQVTFVDAQHGFSYRPALYATDDGGMSWQTVSLGGAVTSLVVGRRFVFAAVQGTCPGTGHCLPSRLYRAARDTQNWQVVASGVASVGNTIAAYGDSVIYNVDEQSGPVSDVVYLSHDDGTSFTHTRGRGPGLYCDFSFGSSTTIYAYCRSGMFFFLSRSDNAGRSFVPTPEGLDTVQLDGCPEGSFAALSSKVVIGLCQGTGPEYLLRSTNGGAVFARVIVGNRQFLGEPVGVGPAGMAFATGGGSNLWWSVDAGTRWRLVTMGTTRAPGVLRCSVSQLLVVLFGGSGAAGTAITGIGIDNKSATPCWLSGRPKISFFTTGKSGKYMRLSVELGYGGPPEAFPASSPVVLLHKGKSVSDVLGRTYPAFSAGIVITSRDFPAGHETCQVVTLLQVTLPGLSDAVFKVPLEPDGMNACDSPPPVDVSPVVTRSVVLGMVGVDVAPAS